MKGKSRVKGLIRGLGVFFVAVGLVWLMSPRVVYADSSQATVIEITGQAQFQKAGTSNWLNLEKTTVLAEGDTIKTPKGSQVKLELTGNAKTAELVVKEDSQFTFKTFQHNTTSQVDDTQLDVDIGDVLVKAEKLVGDSKFEVSTPTSIVGIRGTTFEVKVSKTSE